MQVSSDLSVGSGCRLARKHAACAHCECERGGEAVREEGVRLPQNGRYVWWQHKDEVRTGVEDFIAPIHVSLCHLSK